MEIVSIQDQWIVEVKINGNSILREVVETPDLNPFRNVKAMVGGYGSSADVEVRHLFARTLDDGENVQMQIDI